jgi:hypothetical protein
MRRYRRKAHSKRWKLPTSVEEKLTDAFCPMLVYPTVKIFYLFSNFQNAGKTG